MKTHLSAFAFAVWLMLAGGAAVTRSYAVGGVGDAVIIIGDEPASLIWQAEAREWANLIATANQQVRKTDALIALLGKAEQNRRVFGAPEKLMAPIAEAVKDTRLRALELSKKSYGLNSAAKQVYVEATAVSGSYEALGRTHSRNAERYRRFAVEDAMYDRYTRAVAVEDQAATDEMTIQRDTMSALASAQTHVEVDLANANLAASKQRQDLAHQRAVQAKAELEAVAAKLRVERARKREADREWAQTVVEEMRKKALAAYRAQWGIVDDSPSSP